MFILGPDITVVYADAAPAIEHQVVIEMRADAPTHSNESQPESEIEEDPPQLMDDESNFDGDADNETSHNMLRPGRHRMPMWILVAVLRSRVTICDDDYRATLNTPDPKLGMHSLRDPRLSEPAEAP